MTAFPGFDQPFPPEQLPALESLVKRCCDEREGGGNWMPAAKALQELYTFDQTFYERLEEGFAHLLAEWREKAPRDREPQEALIAVTRLFTRRAENLSKLEEREQALQQQMTNFAAATGPRRMQALFEMEKVLGDTGCILSVPFSEAVVDFLRRELGLAEADHQETEQICLLAGLLDREALIEPLRDLHGRTSVPTVRAAARKALRTLGVAENEVERRMPVKSILVLEPNTFFCKRLVTALEGHGRTVVCAGSRQEAEQLLLKQPMDLLVTECADGTGDLVPWLATAWELRRFRYALLSTASHSLGGLAEKAWVVGKLYKPYQLGELVAMLDEAFPKTP